MLHEYGSVSVRLCAIITFKFNLPLNLSHCDEMISPETSSSVTSSNEIGYLLQRNYLISNQAPKIVHNQQRRSAVRCFESECQGHCKKSMGCWRSIDGQHFLSYPSMNQFDPQKFHFQLIYELENYIEFNRELCAV